MDQNTPIPCGPPGLDQLLARLGSQPQEQDWAELVRCMAKPVHTVAFRICGDASLAEDVSQETFLAVARALPRYRSQGDLQARAWIMRIAANRAISITGRQPRHRRIFTDDLAAAGPDAPSGELLDAVRSEICDLPDRYRLPIVLRFLDGRNYGEIASVLTWTEARARKAVERGLDLLRSRLARRGVPASLALCAAWCSQAGASEPPTPLALTGALARRPEVTAWPLTSSVFGAVIGSAIVAVLATTVAIITTSNPSAAPSSTTVGTPALERFIAAFRADHPATRRRDTLERFEAGTWQMEGPWRTLGDGTAAIDLPASKDWTEARLVLDLPLDLEHGNAQLLAIRCDQAVEDGRFAIGLAGFVANKQVFDYQVGRGDRQAAESFSRVAGKLAMAIRIDRQGARLLVDERSDLPTRSLAELGVSADRIRLGVVVAARGAAVAGHIQVVQILTAP